MELDESERALVDVGRRLCDAGYEHTTVTPETHRRVYARIGEARTLRDVFGWSRSFAPSVLGAPLFEALDRAGAVIAEGPRFKSRVRFSTLGGGLYAHSAYPTTGEGAVFFGPDTYRFCAFVARASSRADRVIDLGCGSGAGGLSLAERAGRIVLADINPDALRLARVNAHLAGVADRVEVVESDLFARVKGPADLVIANPPYLVDDAQRVYRDGGGDLGTSLGLRMARDGLARLSTGGRFVLYTGAPIVDGVDPIRKALAGLVAERGASWTYEELDPDVFGEELERPAYAAVERIAAVGACITLA